MSESVESAINEFYKLKSKYETEIFKKKKTILNNATLSSKEKKMEFKKFKPKCINCKKVGGTIFSSKFYSGAEEYREIKAVCGVISDPCNLNITIQTGKYELLPNMLDDIEKEIQDKKKTIIDDKNRLLFGLITTETALQNFEDIKNYISSLTTLLESYLIEYNSLTDNLEKKNELKENIVKTYFYIEEIKASIIKFNQDNNNQYIRDVANVYITTLKPLLNKIIDLKYKENSVFYNENDNTYNLIQKPYTIQSLEFTDFNKKVISFDVGLAAVVPKKLAKKPFIIESSSSDNSSKKITPLQAVNKLVFQRDSISETPSNDNSESESEQESEQELEI